MLLYLLLVSTAFIGHELSHRMVARHFGCYAEFKMWPTALIFAVGLRVIGFPLVFAAPGAVMFSPFSKKHGMVDNKEVGMIGLAGPLANVALALALYIIFPDLGGLMAGINLSLAMFNMLPFGPLDGAKVFEWSPVIWGLAFFAMFFLQAGLG
jgi:Zn-dependent protease